MKTTPPGGITIPISMEDWSKLLAATAESGYTLEAWEIGSQAVHDWLARNSPATLSRPCTSGYQWKEVFLPKGTLLRTVFNGKHHHCVVEDDGPHFNGEPMSPSRFANAVGGIRRNAWRVIWVLFPNTAQWKLADTLRTKRRAPRRAASQADAGRPTGQPPRRAGSGDAHRARAPQLAQPASQPGRAGPVGSQGARQDVSDHGERERRAIPPERRVRSGERRRPQAASRDGMHQLPRSETGPVARLALAGADYGASPGVSRYVWRPGWPAVVPANRSSPPTPTTKMPSSLR